MNIVVDTNSQKRDYECLAKTLHRTNTAGADFPTGVVDRAPEDCSREKCCTRTAHKRTTPQQNAALFSFLSRVTLAFDF